MRGLVVLAVLVLCGCTGGESRNAPPLGQESGQPIEGSDKEARTMSGAASPSGETHPGEIVHDDKVDGRTWTKKAEEVPQTIAWVEVEGEWKAVVRIEITGTPDRRRITKFGADGDMLESTLTAPRPGPPPRGSRPEPTPVPSKD
jgi:hypothetical protein